MKSDFSARRVAPSSRERATTPLRSEVARLLTAAAAAGRSFVANTNSGTLLVAREREWINNLSREKCPGVRSCRLVDEAEGATPVRNIVIEHLTKV